MLMWAGLGAGGGWAGALQGNCVLGRLAAVSPTNFYDPSAAFASRVPRLQVFATMQFYVFPKDVSCLFF